MIFVTYEEFGAAGDGVTEDFAAIKKAHDYANEKGLPVKAKDGAHYYIHETRINGEVAVAVIKTDTDWTNAKFTIDDRDLSGFKEDENFELSKKPIFRVESDYPKLILDDISLMEKIVSDGLVRDTEKIDIGIGYSAMIIPYNSEHNVYRRRGYGGFLGEPMHEVIVIDAEGNVSSDTPIMFDYSHLDRIEVYRLDGLRPITVQGGEFTTRTCRKNTVVRTDDGKLFARGGYFERSIHVNRSFTTVKNVRHYITDEITVNEQVENGEIVRGAFCYHGFFTGLYANEITFDRCVMTGRRCYLRPQGGTGGTYDLSGNCVNKIVFKNCIQSNFWIKIDENNNITAANEGDAGSVTSMHYLTREGIKLKLFWGVGGTNYCKNMEYYDSTLSRFDAHQGLYNGKIINCTVNFMAITGNGNFTVENTRWFAEGEGQSSNALVYLRADYGSTWEGNISLKNIKAYAYTTAPTHILMHRYTNWYFGYRCFYPEISIDGLEYYDIESGEPLPADYSVYLCRPSLSDEPAMNLENTTRSHPVYPDLDRDGDGLVDGTKIPYDAVVDNKGIIDETSLKNLNPIVPPERIEIKNLAGGVRVLVENAQFFEKTDFITPKNKYHGTKFEDTETFKFIPV